MIEHRAESLAQVFDCVDDIVRGWGMKHEADAELWFRGVNRAKHDLVPGIYRPGNNERLDEWDVFVRFKSFAVPHLATAPATDLDWYFVAEHYGLPTRLLDWTENLLVAVYFALSGDMETIPHREVIKRANNTRSAQNRPVFNKNSPTVWLLDAGSVNQAAVAQDGPLYFGNNCTQVWGPRETPLPTLTCNTCERRCTNVRPIAVLPPQSTRRIVAQQGVFTIHGASNAPLDSYGDILLGRILLPTNRKYQIWRQLLLCGLSPSALFPELDSIPKTLLAKCWGS